MQKAKANRQATNGLASEVQQVATGAFFRCCAFVRAGQATLNICFYLHQNFFMAAAVPGGMFNEFTTEPQAAERCLQA
jgi:hypothetical protein